MKYSILLISFLFSSSFSATCSDPSVSFVVSSSGKDPNGISRLDSYGQSIATTYNGDCYYMQKMEYVFVSSAYGYSKFDVFYTNYSASSCSAGYVSIAPYNVCALPPLSNYDGDRVACMEHGGWTLEGKCITEAEFKTGIKQNKVGFVVGTGLKIGGFLMTAAGVIGLPFTFGASAGLIAAGVHSYGAGALYFALNSTPNFSDNAGNMGSAVTAGGKTIKVSLANYTPSDGSTPISGQSVTLNDDTKKRVTEAVFVPQSVVDQMADPSKVDFVNDTRSTPLDLTGTVKSTYDYSDNTVKTETQVSPTQIKTQVSPFSVIQNPDGSITAKPVSGSSAPTVSGSSSGVFDAQDKWMADIQANYNETQKYWDDIVAGVTPTNDINATKPIDPSLKTNTDILSKLDEIKNAITAGDAPTLSDGTEGFGNLDAQVKGSYSGFIYTDPLGLNALGGGSIPSYGFTLYGRHFVVFDQSMLDNLPLDAIRNLFLFVAAIAAFITVISGV